MTWHREFGGSGDGWISGLRHFASVTSTPWVQGS